MHSHLKLRYCSKATSRSRANYTVAHSGIFLGNFRESSGKFLDNFSFLENFFNVSLLFL